MSESNRLVRVSRLIQSELSRLIREKIVNPKIGLVSIVEVELNADLSLAKIFISPLQGDGAETILGLKKASKYLRHELTKVLELKKVPALRFLLDDRLLKGDTVLDIIEKLS